MEHSKDHPESTSNIQDISKAHPKKTELEHLKNEALNILNQDNQKMKFQNTIEKCIDLCEESLDELGPLLNPKTLKRHSKR